MTRWLDMVIPWFADLTELGGPVLSVILFIGIIIWALLFERLYFLRHVYPTYLLSAVGDWQQRSERTSWFAQQWRNDRIATLKRSLTAQLPMISTLIKVCPLLGLLGTVWGMLEVFDALAVSGSNNPQSLAAGISKATVSTLGGMVIAIVGLLGLTVVERLTDTRRDNLSAQFESGSRVNA